MIATNKVAIYIRVSTTNQAEEGYSIEEQQEKLKESQYTMTIKNAILDIMIKKNWNNMF